MYNVQFEAANIGQVSNVTSFRFIIPFAFHHIQHINTFYHLHEHSMTELLLLNDLTQKGGTSCVHVHIYVYIFVHIVHIVQIPVSSIHYFYSSFQHRCARPARDRRDAILGTRRVESSLRW